MEAGSATLAVVAGVAEVLDTALGTAAFAAAPAAAAQLAGRLHAVAIAALACMYQFDV